MGETCPAQRRAELCRCIIIGGGPAGLACATYYARFKCHTTVIYQTTSAQPDRAHLNVPGYPEGILRHELIARCREQALSMAWRCPRRGHPGDRRSRPLPRTLADGRSSRRAGGVRHRRGRRAAQHPARRELRGRGLRHCPICDGYEANDSRLAIIGVGDKVAWHALFLTAFTERITVLLNGEGACRDDARCAGSSRHGILHESRVADVLTKERRFGASSWSDGTRVDVDRASAPPMRPRSRSPTAWACGWTSRASSASTSTAAPTSPASTRSATWSTATTPRS